jgi:hypothetical protein
MPSLSQLPDLSAFVATLDRHPFGALATIILACIVLAVVMVLKKGK